MFLVLGITGKVGGATAKHLLAHGKAVRALVRNREKAANWANQGAELVDGDWNDSTAIEQALNGVEGAFVMLPPVWAPSADYKQAKGVIANYVEALTKAAPPRVIALSSMGANRTSGLGMITALSLLEQGFRNLTSPIAFVRAGGFFENFLYGLQVAQGGALPVYYNPTNPVRIHQGDGRLRKTRRGNRHATQEPHPHVGTPGQSANAQPLWHHWLSTKASWRRTPCDAPATLIRPAAGETGGWEGTRRLKRKGRPASDNGAL